MGVHAYAMAWASMLLIGAILILVGGLEYPIVVGSPTNAALGFSGNTQVEVYLNKQCIGSSCDTETSESHFIVAAYTLLVFGAVGALIMSIIIFVMAIMYPHSTDLSKRLAGWDFKLTLLAMVHVSIMCLVGWLMIPLSFPDLAAHCSNNVTTTTQIHCGLPCDNNGHMKYFIICGPYTPGSGAFIITVGIIAVYVSPVFARLWVRSYDAKDDLSDGSRTGQSPTKEVERPVRSTPVTSSTA
eukprot:m.51922 g.51922  ORF g.51922 m.51922 type:complete len:242 (+) comp7341_c0_seq1:70-795(+)